jgi:cell elongation-specific peptidoglycan biosynthesis regulator RodA
LALSRTSPDLGTSILVAISGLSIVFLSGLKWPVIAVAGLGGAIAGPLFVMFGLKDYQRERVLTFLDPGRDPLGAGYHITQSKIAIGNGGWTGAGIGQGTQSRLDFLPEQHTDFIFTALAEETGFVGVMVLIGLFGFVFLRLMAIGADCRNLFGRMVASGVAVTIISYVLINMAMVSGLIPVVGVPLPLVSYGGTAMLTVMVGIGLALSARNGAAMTMPPMSSLI